MVTSPASLPRAIALALSGPVAAHPHGCREERPGQVPCQLLLFWQRSRGQGRALSPHTGEAQESSPTLMGGGGCTTWSKGLMIAHLVHVSLCHLLAAEA